MRKIITILITLWLLLNSAFADVIKNYDVQIKVLEDGKIDVVETIEMDIDHKDVRLGITRIIPKNYTIYRQKVETPINILSVMRNGMPEKFWIENRDNNFAILTGEKENFQKNFIPQGTNTYIFHWQSQNHIRSFIGLDELYFNAIGNQWKFSIEKANVTLVLPNSVKVIQSAGYYGQLGDSSRATVTEISPQKIEFTTPKIIGNGQGLTIAVGFTKGMVNSIPLSLYDQILFKLQDYFFPTSNTPWIIEHLLILVYMLGYVAVLFAIKKWYQRGNEPVFMVQYSPPSIKVESAALLYNPLISQKKTDVVVLMDLVAKKYLSIDAEEKTLVVDFNHLEDGLLDQTLSQGQRDFLQYFIKLKRNVVSINVEPKTVRELYACLYKSQKITRMKIYTRWSKWLAWFGLLLLASLLMFLPFTKGLPSLATITIHTITFFVYSIIFGSFANLWKKNVDKNAIFEFITLNIMGAFLLAVSYWVLYGIYSSEGIKEFQNLGIILSSIYCGLMVAIVVWLFRYVHTLKRALRSLHQELLGFKHFLQYTKEEEYKLMSPNIFEKYLVFAVIFDIEHRWLALYEKLYPEEFHQSQTNSGHLIYSLSEINQISTIYSGGSGSDNDSNSSNGYESGGYSSGSGSDGNGHSGDGSGGGGGEGR